LTPSQLAEISIPELQWVTSFCWYFFLLIFLLCDNLMSYLEYHLCLLLTGMYPHVREAVEKGEVDVYVSPSISGRVVNLFCLGSDCRCYWKQEVELTRQNHCWRSDNLAVGILCQCSNDVCQDKFASERRRAKTLNFSIAYGKTAKGCCTNSFFCCKFVLLFRPCFARLSEDWNVSLQEAEETLEKW
jgi:hypothetical protein